MAILLLLALTLSPLHAAGTLDYASQTCDQLKAHPHPDDKSGDYRFWRFIYTKKKCHPSLDAGRNVVRKIGDPFAHMTCEQLAKQKPEPGSDADIFWIRDRRDKGCP